MYEPELHRSKRGRTNLASCLVATVFLLVAAAIIAIYFFVFKPKPPKIAVHVVQFPTFFVTNDTVSFTFFQFVSVTNPNNNDFTHNDSSLQLFAGN